MTTFARLQPDGSLTEVREIAQSSLLKCPHVIMMAEHYREDGTCRCNDKTATVMRTWGYRWSKKQERWI